MFLALALTLQFCRLVPRNAQCQAERRGATEFLPTAGVAEAAGGKGRVAGGKVWVQAKPKEQSKFPKGATPQRENLSILTKRASHRPRRNVNLSRLPEC